MSLRSCFVGKKGEKQPKVPVARDSQSVAVFAHVASRTGERGAGVARAAPEDVDLLGHTRVPLQGDQGPALKEPRSNVKTAWAGEAVREHSPVGSPQSSGAAKRATRPAKEQVRVP